MRIIVDINHPAHVHFFKNFIWEVQKAGHEVLITAINKDIALSLLDYYKFAYTKLGNAGKNLPAKLAGIPILDLKMYLAARKFRPSAILGIASFKAAHIAFLLRNCRSYIFDDTEHARAEIALYRPFASRILVPDCWIGRTTPKHLAYPGFHELAYLHPHYFIPDPAGLRMMGLTEKDKFFIVRFVAWRAGHDLGQKGFSLEGKRRLVKELERHGRVFISSEGALPSDLERYQISVHPAQIHSLLHYAAMYIGEGGTMATESAVLGTPSVLVNSLTAGTFQALENKYQLMLSFRREEEALQWVENIPSGGNLKELWRMRREKMLKEKIDVTAWMMELVLSEGKAGENTSKRI